MKELIWNSEKDKRVEIKVEGGTASLHFAKGKNIFLPDVIWGKIQKKLSNDLENGKLTVKEKETKKKKKYYDDQIKVEEL
jgi:hypothetical protein